MVPNDDALAESFGPCRHEVILSNDFEDGGTSDARDDGGESGTERHRRHQEMLKRTPESGKIPGNQTIQQIKSGDRLDLNAIFNPAGNRQQIPLAAEKIDQHDAEPKVGQRDADE